MIKSSRNKTGTQYYNCRDCNNKRQRAYYEKNKEKCRSIIYRSIAKHADKQAARKKVHYALMKKVIVRPSNCEECKQEKKIQAHHTDYSQPLVVQWLCVDCHCNKHKDHV